ncbi:MAG: GNAT family N-acetyltransferase [Aggregatilineales bacterium]
MHTLQNNGDALRRGTLVYLDALSKALIGEIADTPFSEAALQRLNHGKYVFPVTAQDYLQAFKADGDVVFALHLQDDKHCIGAVRLRKLHWHTRYTTLEMGIIDDEFFTVAILRDVIQIMVRFAFLEVNLNRVAVHCVAGDIVLDEALQAENFTDEGRFRQDVYRNGRYLDTTLYSILKREWTT